MAYSRHSSGSLVNDPCPYLAPERAAEPAAGGGPARGAPPCTCILAEELVARLASGQPKSRLIGKLTEVRSDGRRAVICGPDEMLVVSDWCTAERCAGACQPRYLRLLEHYGLNTSLPPAVAEPVSA